MDGAWRGSVWVDKALILQDISAEHGEGKEEEKGLSKPTQSQPIILVMVSCLWLCFKHFSPQELILCTRSALQIKM